ncbi:MAG: hypothetical protein FD123_2 [Bacteroidetes bacterium]|nr:MAG: hypothetical protein FD123_2 [Bacteroidota bacterium]
MQKPNTKKVWCRIPAEDIIKKLDTPGLTPEYLSEFCKHAPERVSSVAAGYAEKTIEQEGIEAVVIAAFFPMMDEDYVECVILLGAQPEEIEKLISQSKCFNQLEPLRQYDATTHTAMIQRTEELKQRNGYERMKASAFNLMRKNNIKDFSPEELHRVFKHAREQLVYTSIVRMAVEDGLTITSLYEQDRDRGLGR